jgi:flavodoxin
MKKAIVVYQSKTGITKKFGEEIGNYITGKGIEVKVHPVQDLSMGLFDQADYVLLGCWTAGLMLFLQHPDMVWKQFAVALPALTDKKTALFTTYKLATGSMFTKMRKHLAGKDADAAVELKSRNGNLSVENKIALDRFLEE